MKHILIVLGYIVFVTCQTVYYDRKYDYYDIDNLVHNPRLLRKYLDCFLDKGPCTPVGRFFKVILPEVVRTACAKCSPSQKRFARRTLEAFKQYHPQQYFQLIKKLDPQNKYFIALEKAIS